LENDRHELVDSERKMQSNLDGLERTLSELRRKKNSLSCRQRCVDALKAADAFHDNPAADIEDTFARWESDVMTKEMVGERYQEPTDQLKEDFEKEEQEKNLKAMLDQLVCEPAESSENDREGGNHDSSSK
jgi:hypothetical protein